MPTTRSVVVALSALALAAGACAPDGGPSVDESPALRVIRGPSTTVGVSTAPAPADVPVTTSAADPVATTGPPAPVPPVPPAPVPVGDPRVLLLGDSVLEALGPGYTDQARLVLEPLGWQVTVDTAVSRSSIAAVEVLQARRAEVGGAAVILIGYNDGNVSRFARQVDAMLETLLGVPRVVLVTLQEADDTYAAMNDVLREAASARPDTVVLLDWQTLAASLPGVNEDDDLHLTPKGAEALARFIGTALGPAPVPAPAG